MDPVTTSSITSSIQSVGFPVVIALLGILGCWKLLDRFDARIDQRDKDHRAEREADRAAHLTALGALTSQLDKHGQTLAAVAEDVREIRREVEPPRVQRGG